MANEKMDLIKHMALLRNVANDVTEILGSTAAADFINAAIEIINDYPSGGKLVDTGTKSLHIPRVSGSLPADMEVKAEIVDRIGRKNLDSEEGIKRVVLYEKGFTDCIDWLRKRQ